MAISIIIHLAGADTIMAEIDDLPDPTASYIVCSNPRSRDGKQIVYIDRDAEFVLFPWSRITFVETLPAEDIHEDIESFFRD